MNSAMEYRRVEINTSDKVRIVSLLYDGAISFMRMALQGIEDGDIVSKGLYIGKATSIVGELSSSLNMEAGGEISPNLKRLYDFILDRLFHANMRNDRDAMDVAIKVLDVLRDAWKDIEKNQHCRPAVEGRTLGMGVRV